MRNTLVALIACALAAHGCDKQEPKANTKQEPKANNNHPKEPKTATEHAVKGALDYVLKGEDPMPEYKEAASAIAGGAGTQAWRPNLSTPEATVRSAFDAVNRGELTAFRECKRLKLDKPKSHPEHPDNDFAHLSKLGPWSVEVREVKMEGANEAKVRYTVRASKPFSSGRKTGDKRVDRFSADLRRVDGRWFYVNN